MGKQYNFAITFDELYKGLQKSKRNVIWKDSVAGYSINGLKNTYLLRQSLLKRTYHLSKYQRFTIVEPKVREIIATRIRDRQFQRSLCDNILYPEAVKHFIRDNCACQKGRGVDDAMNRMDAHLHKYFRKEGTNRGWVLQCDISKYFPSTPYTVAQDALIKVIKDKEAAMRACEIIESFCCAEIEKRLLAMGVDQNIAEGTAYKLSMQRVEIIKAKIMTPDEVDEVNKSAHKKMRETIGAIPSIKREEKEGFFNWMITNQFRGIGLGSQVSQITELTVLNGLDHYIKEKLRVKHYIRYMDDFIIIHSDKNFLRQCKKEIETYIGDLGLSLNKKTCIYPLQQGIRFLKWRFILTETGKVIRRKNKKKVNDRRRKLRKFKERLDNGLMTMSQISDSFQSWRADALRGNMRRVILDMEDYYRKLFGEEPPICKKTLK